MASHENPKKKARILVVDDHPMIRESLARLIDKQKDLVCCGEAGTVSETQTIAMKQKPDLAILDLRLKNADGLELIKSLKAQLPNLKILILSQCEGALYAERALRAGALGYLDKEQAADEVLNAIHTVLKGEIYLTRGLAAVLLHKLVGPKAKLARGDASPLTDRELHVLDLLGTGMSTREIASALSLSFKTVESHRENIKHKLGLDGAAALTRYALEWSRRHASTPPDVPPPEG
jgi:DNA-binding NarL/FixJ family response regulator